MSLSQIEDLRFGIDGCARRCLYAPPTEMVHELVEDLAEVQQHIGRQQPPVIQQGLYQAAALLAVLIADELMVLGNPQQSQAWHSTARHLADQSTDTRLRADVRALAALLPLYFGDPLETIRLTQEAERLLEGRPILASVLAPMYQAAALARLNAADASDQALRRARQRMQTLDESYRTDSVFGLAEQRWQFYQGRILSSLGRVEEAWEIHEQALARYPEEVVGDPALILFDRSISLVRSRQITAGCELADATLLRLPQQHRTGIFLRAAHQVINAVPAEDRSSPPVANYRQTLRSCTAGTPA